MDPPGLRHDTSTTISSHGTTANPKLCASCHVSRFNATDAQGDAFTSVGHLFEAIPCVDATGLPKAGPCPSTERNFTGCTQGNCHLGPGNEAQVRALFDFLENQTINQKLDQLWADTDADGVLETSDGGLLPQLVAVDTVQLDVRSTKLTVAKGALWNAQLAYTSSRTHWASGRTYVGTAGSGKLGITFSAHKASGNGVHNPFFLEALLNATISAVMTEYGLAPPAGLDLEVRATPPPRLRRASR